MIFIMKPILFFLSRIFTILIVLTFSIPVALLPFSTEVPTWIWIPLALTDLILIILFFRIKYVGKKAVIPIFGVLVIGVIAVITSQLFTMTPQIVDRGGKPLQNSIATLETVSLNGSRQWISVRGQNISNPVLLFLAGGPGGSQLATARFALSDLEQHFIVVNWEQPGAGKSFDAVNRSALTVERYIDDAYELILQLRARFGQEKVYLLGESWGSALGIMLVQQYPELFHAFIGTGQMVAFLENDLMCYDFSLALAKENGNLKKVEKLTHQGPPPYFGKDVAWQEAAFLMDTFNAMNANPAISDNGANTFRDLAAPEYGLYDKVNWFRGVIETLTVVYPQLWEVDFRKSATKLDVPIYFFIGRHDVNAPTILLEEYFRILKAPHKEIIWFEHSGHTPWVSESGLFVEEMVKTVKAQTWKP